MKLRLGAKDLDLADRLNVANWATFGNIFHPIMQALRELLCEGIVFQGLPSQLLWSSSMPQSFEYSVLARTVMDTYE